MMFIIMQKKSPKILQMKADYLKFHKGFQKLKNVLVGITMLAFAFVLTGSVQGQNWDDPPAGYTRVFHDDFSQPYTGGNNWQGVDQSKWEINSVDGEPNQSGANADKWPFYGTNVMVKNGGGLYSYGGRRPELCPGDNSIENDEVALSSFSTQENVVRPGSSGPRIIRIRTEWEQARGYIFAPWAFSSWVDVDAGGHTYRHGWEFDLETKGSEYDPVNRTFVAHFNNHTWVRIRLRRPPQPCR